MEESTVTFAVWKGVMPKPMISKVICDTKGTTPFLWVKAPTSPSSHFSTASNIYRSQFMI